MGKKLVFAASALFVLISTSPPIHAGLIAHYTLEGNGKDRAANPADGTLVGSPTFEAGPTGFGQALRGGTGKYVDCQNAAKFALTGNMTVMCWAKVGSWLSPGYDPLVTKGSATWRLQRWSTTNTMVWGVNGVGGVAYVVGNIAVNDGQWHHFAGVYDHVNLILYVDGQVDNTFAATGTPVTTPSTNMWIGGNSGNTVRFWDGWIDDVRIYDTGLSQAEIATVMKDLTSPGNAVGPNPANKAADVVKGTNLSWRPGVYAATHDVYFGTTSQAVDGASRTAPGTVLVSKDQDPNSYDPGPLEFGKTYYWRVDEVNAPPSTKIFKGDVWSFTVEPVSVTITEGVTAEADSSFDASSVASKTVDGSGLDPNTGTHGITASDMWISGTTALPHWIQYSFDKLYKLDQMAVWNSNQTMEGLFGLGAKSVLVQYSADGAAWTDLGTFQFTKGPGNTTCAADTKVPFNGAAAKYVKLNITSNWGGLFQQASLSEVRFYAIPVAAREPSPAPGSANLHPQVPMSWRAGRDAVSHEVYVGSDANAVAASTTPTATVDEAKYDAALGLGQTYYWKVVEVNQATSPTSWPSDVWSFSTATSIAIDDFESYTNDSPRRVFQTWIDGGGFSPDEYFPNGNSGNGSGAIVGNDPQLGDIMELTYTSAGKQSMPLFYDNSTGSKISEAIRTLDPAKDTTDWSKYGLTTLVLFFRGDPANGAAPVYVKINNTKKVYGVAAATTIAFWRQWNIDLASIPAADLKNVQTITIGVGDGSAGGSGTILVDEIRLYAAAPAIPVPSDPGTTGLIAYYAMNGDVLDGSGSANSGTLVGEPGFVDGMAAFGKALAFDGIDDCVDLGKKDAFNPTGSFSVSLWANITAWGTAWNHVMIGNRGESSLGWQIRRHSSTSLCFTTRGADQDDTASTMIPPQNEWINIVCVYDDAAGTKTIYIDGHQDKVVNTTAGKHIAATTMNTYIGARAAAGNTPEAFFTGMLDEIRLFNRALTAGEAAYLAGDR